MLDDEKVLKQIHDTMVHKQFVLKSCFLMAEHLYNEGQKDLALSLMQRAANHDNSKFNKEELYNLALINDNNMSFINPNSKLDKENEKLIELHWKNNSHHPEHFENYDDMSELDIIEMVCDWHARSSEFGTDLMEFFETRQKNRFHFSDEQYNKIKNYCQIIILL